MSIKTTNTRKLYPYKIVKFTPLLEDLLWVYYKNKKFLKAGKQATVKKNIPFIAQINNKYESILKIICRITSSVLTLNIQNFPNSIPLSIKVVCLQHWIYNRRIDAKAKTPIIWSPDEHQLVGKDPDAGKDWRQKEKGVTKVEMVIWHYQLNGHESAQTPGDSERQGSLACCSPCGHKESDRT